MWEPTIYTEDIKKIVNIVEQIDFWESNHPRLRNHVEYLSSELDKAWEEMRQKQLANWPGVKIITNQIEKKLHKQQIRYRKHIAITGSTYITVNGRELRISDHEYLKEGTGGWNRNHKCRYAEPDVNFTPFSGMSCKEAVQELIKQPVFVAFQHKRIIYKHYEKQQRQLFATTQ